MIYISLSTSCMKKDRKIIGNAEHRLKTRILTWKSARDAEKSVVRFNKKITLS